MTNSVPLSASDASLGDQGTQRVAFVFSGHGSQSYFMAKDLFDRHSGFRRQMKRVDGLFEAALGRSVLEYLYDPQVDKLRPFDTILFSLPATFMVQYAMAQALIEGGVDPGLAVGASLGEVSAAVIAGALSLEDSVSAVAAMARLLDDAGLTGGMTAVLHNLDVCRRMEAISRNSEIAAINYESNFVVAGSEAGLDQIHRVLTERGITFQRLPVKQPFHSALLDRVLDGFHRDVPTPRFSAPRIPLVSCTSGGPVTQLGSEYLWNAIRRPIQTMQTVRSLEEQGCFHYIDMGPGASFGNCIKRILKNDSQSRIYQPLNPFARGGESLEETVRALARARTVANGHQSRADLTSGYLFPGQGSQYAGMGAGLFDEFKDLTEIADQTLGYSIKRLCTIDPDKLLALTQFTQPAVYVVNTLTYFQKIRNGECRPGFVAGHSLGEYNALLAAGAFDFETGLRLVRKRGELMSRVSGAMAAVVGLDASRVAEILEESGLKGIDIANFNAPEQTVLAGPADEIREGRRFFADRGARYVPLNVSAPFHSRYMEPAMREFQNYLATFKFSPLSCSVISNVDARPYRNDSIPRLLTEQICKPVQWTATICYLLDQKVEHLFEVGPGQVLTKLVAGIQRSRR